MGIHSYAARVIWTGARQGPTTTYQAYSREYGFQVDGKAVGTGSADPTFRGDPALYNPEEMLVVALSSCHLLSYLAECARGGVYVISYEDDATGTMAVKDGRMRMVEVVLRPRVTIARGSDIERARALHERAHEECYIANSVNFPVRHDAAVSFVD
ncbi:MAG TPA: OsmC family protein [Gemmatimonadaceae bacterium]